MDRATATIWQFAPGEKADHWDEFHAEGIIAISFSANVGDLRQYNSREALAERVAMDDANYSVLQLEYFRDAEVGDVVVAKRGLKMVVGVGVIAGPYEYHGNRQSFWHVRKTRWLVSTEIGFYERIFTRGTFFRTTKWTAIRERLLEAHPELTEELTQVEGRRTRSHESVRLRSVAPVEGSSQEVYTHEQALRESGLAASTFEEYWELLRDKRQVVFQGPPGTGKTYLAEIYARLLVAGDMQRLEVVQFHPSYSYEDFVEGYRPTVDGGLAVRDGIFKLICEKAQKSGEPTVLIIDEINRGDLSKIFGELLYLLEYRGKKIKLTHNPTSSFEIPENLYLIGTMNTADRSLALIDYALRRRFSFISLEPQYELVRRLVKSDQLNVDHLVRNWSTLNSAIVDNTALGKEFQIGQSYLLRHPQLTVVKLEQVWRFDIEPLLREYYFDAQEQLPRLRELFFDGLLGA